MHMLLNAHPEGSRRMTNAALGRFHRELHASSPWHPPLPLGSLPTQPQHRSHRSDRSDSGRRHTHPGDSSGRSAHWDHACTLSRHEQRARDREVEALQRTMREPGQRFSGFSEDRRAVERAARRQNRLRANSMRQAEALQGTEYGSVPPSGRLPSPRRSESLGVGDGRARQAAKEALREGERTSAASKPQGGLKRRPDSTDDSASKKSRTAASLGALDQQRQQQ